MSDKTRTQSGARLSIYAIIGLILLVVLLGAAAYIAINRYVLREPAAPLENVTIANFVYTGSCPLIAAQAKGYFTSEGVQVSSQVYSTGKASLGAMFGGKADLSISGEMPVMFAVLNRQPLAVIATIARGDNVTQIIGKKDRGISTPASLKGKRIGVSIGTAGHFMLNVFLTRQKMSINDVTLRDLKTEELAGALARDEIDAASTWEPTVGEIQAQLGANGVSFQAGDLYIPVLTIGGTQTYVASHTQTLQKVLRGLIRGDDFCRDNPVEARELIGAYFKVDANTLLASWSDYRFRVSLDQSLVLQLEDEARWAINNKLTKRSDMPNYLDHLDLDALQIVAPAAVTVIH